MKTTLSSARRTLAGLGVAALAAAAGVAIAPAAGAATPATCGTPLPVVLYAGQTTNAGTVTVSNDADELFVTYATTDPWRMTKTQVAVGDTLTSIPVNKAGNPVIGSFAHQAAFSPAASTYTLTIPKTSLSLDANQAVSVAAHADLVKLAADGSVLASETGWAAGKRFVERGSWATYIGSYVWQECVADKAVETTTETAFAFGGGTNAIDTDGTSSFLEFDLDGDGKDDFNRWGWTNGPVGEGTYTYPLYAGAGQSDTAKGTLVGEVKVVYSGGTATVTYTTKGTNPVTGQPYTMVEAQAYAGGEVLPRNKQGDYTVAPGQYPKNAGELKNVTSTSFTFTGLSGPIHVVAHATVAGFPVG